jgi:hypothetical protein
MKKTKNESNIKISLSVCDECNMEKPARGFTNLVSGEGLPSKSLCPSCYNLYAAKKMGIAPPEPSEFPPISLFDSIGKEHTFYFQVRISVGLCIIAQEINERGESCGYQFSIMQHPEIPVVEVYSKLVEKIKRGLSVRYLESSDFISASQNRLYVKHDSIVGRIEENEQGPTAVIDGVEYSWEEVGQFVSSHMGFNFRLEIFDPYDKIDISPKTDRDAPSWLKKPLSEEKDRKFQ